LAAAIFIGFLAWLSATPPRTPNPLIMPIQSINMPCDIELRHNNGIKGPKSIDEDLEFLVYSMGKTIPKKKDPLYLLKIQK